MSVQPPAAAAAAAAPGSGSGFGSPHPSQLPGPTPSSSSAVGNFLLPSPPFISAPGLINLRDIGGYEIPSTTSGHRKKMVRKGVVFRSADPTQLTDEGVAVMQKLGITHVYDFRSKLEFGKTPETEPKEWAGAQRCHVPVFPDVDMSPEALAVRFQLRNSRFRDYTDGPAVSVFLCFALFFFFFCILSFPFLFSLLFTPSSLDTKGSPGRGVC